MRGGARWPAQQGVNEGQAGRWSVIEERGKTGSPFIGYWRQVHGCCYSTTYHLPPTSLAHSPSLRCLCPNHCPCP